MAQPELLPCACSCLYFILLMLNEKKSRKKKSCRALRGDSKPELMFYRDGTRVIPVSSHVP